MSQLTEHKFERLSKELSTAIWQSLLEKGSLQEGLAAPEKRMMQFYEYAQELFAFCRYQDAEAVLFVLTLLAPDRPALWVSLGLARQQLGLYDMAQIAFDHASTLAPTYVEPYFYALILAHQLHQDAAVKAYYEKLTTVAVARKEDAYLLEEAKKLMEATSHDKTS